MFSGGELILTEADGVLDGTFTLDSAEGPFTGTFTVPVCPKTEEEHLDIAGLIGFECVPPPTLQGRRLSEPVEVVRETRAVFQV